MSTMYRTGAVTHQSDDTRPGKALCGRSVVGWLDLDSLDAWSRVGFSAASNGPCISCGNRALELAVHPDRSIADAYRAGWNASAKLDGPDLETSEARYARTHNEMEQDAFAAGWIDYASDNTYGHAVRVPLSLIPTAKDPIVIDNTPAGIYSAMMRANASEQTAPQSRLYGLLSEHLTRTLANTYGTDAGVYVYGAIMRSGEAGDDIIMGALEDFNYLQNDGLIYTQPQTGARTYIGPAIHGGSPADHVRAALQAAQDHPVPAVRDYLTRALTEQLARTTRPVLTPAPMGRITQVHERMAALRRAGR